MNRAGSHPWRWQDRPEYDWPMASGYTDIDFSQTLLAKLCLPLRDFVRIADIKSSYRILNPNCNGSRAYTSSITAS